MEDAVKHHSPKLKCHTDSVTSSKSFNVSLPDPHFTESAITVFILFTLSTLEARSPLLCVPGITYPYFQLWVLEYKDISKYVGEMIKITAEMDRTGKKKIYFSLNDVKPE